MANEREPRQQEEDDKGPTVYTFEQDEAYLDGVLVLATSKPVLTPTLNAISRIEAEATETVTDAPYSSMSNAAHRNLGRIAALRDFGII